ncbi:uncharacterized protein LOC125217519 [Salvia hispanica]|uniref:uncharacterized protein LOC125217519 n=1 Tax=Salvia hispanica TaxID=49212 RepID=UPI002009115D|nr:uncharacterized protein LOC125217519 [Salvia hispanica]
MSEELQIVVAQKNVEAQYVEMMVPLYSFGCERKIKNALANLKGIYSVNVDFEQQKVRVWGICDKCDVLSKVKKKRRGARFWELEDEIRVQELGVGSAPSSPQHSSISINNNSAKYLALIKPQSLNLNWRALKRVFNRSNSF